jgi:multicomponent Na+:H+ antiporter subunit G
MMTFFGFFFILLGMIAFLISGIGLLRMPDLYARIHAGAKSPTMATILVIIGAIFLEPSWAAKLILLALFILATNPLSSSVIARASHKIDIPYINRNDVDELKDLKIDIENVQELENITDLESVKESEQ